MVVKFGVQQNRGAAGESNGSGGGRGYNFANLYQLNRADNQTQNEVSQIGGKIRSAQSDVDRFGRYGSQAARGGESVNPAMSGIASAVESARTASNQANEYNPAVSFMKSGASPYQAGVGDFYSGGNAARQNAKKFSGIYNDVQQTARGWQQRLPGMEQSGRADHQAELDRQAAIQKSNSDYAHQVGVQGAQNSARNAPYQNGIRPMQNLDWMLKTGRISAQDMYRAQKDKQFYDYLMQRYS